MSLFPAIRIEGGLLGPDTLEQLLAGELPGQKPKDFGLDGRRSLTDEIASVFADARAEWEVFQRRLERLPEGDAGTSVTRDAWMIPFLSLLGYELRYNPRAYEVDGLTFAISHRAGEPEDAPPVHIVGARQELGRLAPTGRPRLAPHSLVQEYLNRTEHLWGLVTNGLTLRLLRDSTYVRRQAYVEFDLQQIFEEQRFGDFAVLYRLLHRSRLPRSAADARDCLLEQYYQHAVEQGGRVRDRLRDGVEECIKRLANGFLAHPANGELRQRVVRSEQGGARSQSDQPLATRHSPLTPEELYRQLLRLVYRLLFLLVSEDRGLISAEPLYRDHYGVARLRRLLERRSAYTEHDDIWCSLRVLWKVLSDERLADLLGAAPLNGELFAPLALDHCTITNRDFLEAFWHLAYYRESPSAPPRRVNYAALDVEELGSVYESLLEYHPQIEASRGVPGFELALGSERKSTGSYYTPPELVAELLRSALEPVIADRLAAVERAATEIRRVASGEWRVVQEKIQQLVGEKDADSIVSRLGSLAESHGAGGRSLSPHERLPEGGALRPDQPNAPSSDVGPSEHRRGLGTARNEGISAIPEHRLGQSSGARDLPPARRTGWDREAGTRPSPSSDARNPEQADGQPPAQSQTEVTRSITDLPALWASLPLATRHSLLARALAEHAVLSIRILDPACGSGHFLLAAARRLGKELAKIRTGEDEPAPERVREAIRDVVARSIYGVDKNPLAVELCRVALWLEAHCAGKPLTFLDHRIRCGDSLVGVLDLRVLKDGIPDEAFAPVSTDAKETANLLKKRNRGECRALESGQMRLPFAPERVLSPLGDKHHDIEAIADDSPAAVREKKSRYDRLLADPGRLRIAEACDLWTAAFFQRFTPGLATSPAAITTDAVTDRLAGRAHPQALAAARALAEHHHFFHWPLEFPEVFQRAASGEQRAVNEQPDPPLATPHSPLAGFDVVLSNPPWERIKLQEEEFFASRDPEIARAPNAAARKRLIARLRETHPALWQAYQEALHDADATSKFLRTGGRYPLTGRGDINTYSVFAELAAKLISPRGRAGIVVPTGIATDATNQHFFRHLVESGRLVSLYDFENRKKLFLAVDSRMKFCLLTLRGKLASVERQVASGAELAEFAFFCQEAADLRDAERRFMLSPQDFRLLNPNTGTAPIFRSRRDAELTRHIYRRVPVLIDETLTPNPSPTGRGVPEGRGEGLNPWGVEFLAMFHMANDSHLFRTREELEAEGYQLEGNVFVKRAEAYLDPTTRDSLLATRYLPLYEAKMIHQFDHRFGDYRDLPEGSKSTQLPEVPLARLADPTYQVLPRYWVPAEEVEARLRAKGWDRGWLLGWRNITNVTNERTVIAAVIPRVGVGHSMPVFLMRATACVHCFYPMFASFVLDFAARQKVGGTNLTYNYIEQLPVLPPSVFERPCPWSPGGTIADWLRPRVLELTYTAWDLKPFAEDLWESADEAGRLVMLEQWEENHGERLRDLPHSPLATRRYPPSATTPSDGSSSGASWTRRFSSSTWARQKNGSAKRRRN